MYTKICFCLILVLSGSLSLFAQSMKIRMEVRGGKESQSVWILHGETDLPSYTALVAYLSFEGKQMSESQRYGRVLDGKFTFEYGPFAAAFPSGAYSWKVDVREGQSSSPLSQEIAFYHGSPYQKRKEEREGILFYQKMMQSVEESALSLKTKREDLLRTKKGDFASLKNDIEERHRQFRIWQFQCEEKNAQYVLDRMSEVSREMKRLFSFFQRILAMHTVEVYLYFSMPVPQQYASLAKQFSENSMRQKDLQEYEKHLTNSLKKLSSFLPSGKNLQAKDLEEDLLWLNEIYQNFNREYAETRGKSKKAWQEKVALFLEELERYQSRTQEYALSPLTTSYPELLPTLQSLTREMQNLVRVYDAQWEEGSALATKKNALKEQTIENLGKHLDQIDLILSKYKEAQTQKIDQAEKAMSQSFGLLGKLHEASLNALQSKTLEEFLPLLTRWSGQNKDFLLEVRKWTRYFPEQSKLFYQGSLWMEHRLDAHKQLLEGKSPQDPEWKAQIKMVDLQIPLLLDHIQQSLKKN